MCSPAELYARKGWGVYQTDAKRASGSASRIEPTMTDAGRVWYCGLMRYSLLLLFVLLASCESEPKSNWDRNNQGIGEPVSSKVVERLERHDREHGLDDLEPEFRGNLRQLLSQLRQQGWAARVAVANRTVEKQRALFDKRLGVSITRLSIIGLSFHSFPAYSKKFRKPLPLMTLVLASSSCKKRVFF